jgi:cytochrome bd-type quinol oxidase subunit 2
MNNPVNSKKNYKRGIMTFMFLLFLNTIHASEGGFEDKLADIMTWVVLIVLPPAGLYLFWIAHIYPEKVAEKRHHPQVESIKMLCFLSLFVGGLLWPFALVWAHYNYDTKTTEDPKIEESPE